MKTELTVEQSQRLFSLGIPLEKASIFRTDCPARVAGFRDEHLFTIKDLVELVPKVVEDYEQVFNFRMEYFSSCNEWYVGHYIYGICLQSDFSWQGFHSPELIDALYKLIVWCKEWDIREVIRK